MTQVRGALLIGRQIKLLKCFYGGSRRVRQIPTEVQLAVWYGSSRARCLPTDL